MGLARLQRCGHTPIAIVGGGTGMIGDPSGKSQERQLLTRDQIDANVAGIRAQLERFLDFDAPANAARIVDNAEWLGTIDLLSFLRDAGKHFTVNYMLQKESVSRRLESEDGISFTEFSYLLLQAYDFVQLFDRHHCTLQLGGSDQWGNITAGIDLIRKLRAVKAHGLVWPLLTTSSGTKFGKTEAGTIWLDSARTSPFKFYQFWLNTDDSDVVSYLKCFTFLDHAPIDALETATRTAPEKREAQRVLAREVTTTVLLESAYFNPGSVRRTSRALGLHTDAAYRFERGADIEGLREALDRAAQLMADLGGGTVAKGVVDVYPGPKPRPRIALRRSRIERLIGPKEAGGRFLAITDPGSKMQQVAERDGFRRVFLGWPSIGGRYSVLSDFGLVDTDTQLQIMAESLGTEVVNVDGISAGQLRLTGPLLADIYLGKVERECYAKQDNQCIAMSGPAIDKFHQLENSGRIHAVYANADVVIFQVAPQ
jgi:hypothetical protein